MNYKFRQFTVDYNMLFVIQSFLGEKTEEILSTLHELAATVTTESLKTTRATHLNKRAKFFYKKSKVPILLVATSSGLEYHKKNRPNEPLPIDIDIRFPKKVIRVDPGSLQKMSEHNLEKSLGLRDDALPELEDLAKPEVAVPRGLKGVL